MQKNTNHNTKKLAWMSETRQKNTKPKPRPTITSYYLQSFDTVVWAAGQEGHPACKNRE